MRVGGADGAKCSYKSHTPFVKSLSTVILAPWLLQALPGTQKIRVVSLQLATR